MKNAFRSASSIRHKKVSVLVLVLNTRLGLGLEKSLDYITVLIADCVNREAGKLLYTAR